MRLLRCTVLLVVALAGCSGDDGPADPGGSPTAAPTGDGTEPAGEWREVAPLPQERTENSAVGLDGGVYVAGGFGAGGGGLPTEFFIYDPADDTWREGAPVPAGRHHAPLAAYDGRVYLVGGYAGGSFSDPQDTLFVYDVASDSWSEGPPMPEPRGAHAVAVTGDGQIHVIGGEHGGPRTEQFVFDTATETWSSLPAMPTPREHIGAAYLDGVIYVAVGRDGGDGAMRTFEAYDVAAQEWTSLPEVPTGRSGVAVVAFEEQVYVFGGESFDPDQTYDAAERFDPVAGAWQALPPMPTDRHGLGAGVLDDGILVVGGGPEAGLTYSGSAELWRP